MIIKIYYGMQYILSESEYNDYLNSSNRIKELEEMVDNKSIIKLIHVVSPSIIIKNTNIAWIFGKEANEHLKVSMMELTHEVENLREENKRLKNRSLMDRIFNI